MFKGNVQIFRSFHKIILMGSGSSASATRRSGKQKRQTAWDARETSTCETAGVQTGMEPLDLPDLVENVDADHDKKRLDRRSAKTVTFGYLEIWEFQHFETRDDLIIR